MEKLKTCWCLGCAWSGSIPNSGDGFISAVITGLAIPNHWFCPGLSSGLDSHCFKTNGLISGVKRAALLQQKKHIPGRALSKWWSLSSIQPWGHPCLWDPQPLACRNELAEEHFGNQNLARQGRCSCVEFDFSMCARPWGSMPLIFPALIAAGGCLRSNFLFKVGSRMESGHLFSSMRGEKKVQFGAH